MITLVVSETDKLEPVLSQEVPAPLHRRSGSHPWGTGVLVVSSAIFFCQSEIFKAGAEAVCSCSRAFESTVIKLIGRRPRLDSYCSKCLGLGLSGGRG